MKDTQQNEESDLHDILGGEKVVIVTKGKKREEGKGRAAKKKKRSPSQKPSRHGRTIAAA